MVIKKGVTIGMIEWKVYDEDNPPEYEKNYIVLDEDEDITQAKLRQRGQYTDIWEDYSGGYIKYVTHYAEINLPNHEPREVKLPPSNE